MVAFKDRVGERFISNEGYEFVIIKYNRNDDVWIEFQDEYKARIHTDYRWCRQGKVKNPYHPSIYKHGFIGQGEYEAYIDKIATEPYRDWYNIMIRGFDEEFKKKHPTYKDVTVNPEIYNFQDFGIWREHNYYEIDGEIMDLDKDILYKGNKEYSFNTMIYVPQRINKLFIKNDANRGKYPIGVSYHKDSGKYIARCQTLNSRKHLGYYDNPHKAFLAYKEFKEAYIKEIADEYKDKIPQRLYDAMYNWVIEEDD